MAKKLVNDPTKAALEAVEGLLLMRPDLTSIEGYPMVVVRKDIDEVKKHCVTLISGGGSGHEPAHAGFIGPGMLSGAACGGVFASPSVAEVLGAIRVCAGPHGVLLIVKNYTGDRINFGVAQEIARQEGIDCMMCVVDDDCALPKGKGITGGRGVAGTVLIHKIVGAMAARGTHSLSEIHAAACYVVKHMSTLGVALTTCTIPGSQPSSRLSEPSLMEVGMGIHGEPGRDQRAMIPGQSADQVAEIMVEAVLHRLGLDSNNSVDTGLVILLNNLGGLPVLEMQIVAKTVLKSLNSKGGLVPMRCYCGHYMTSLEMSGISLTVLRLADTDVDSSIGSIVSQKSLLELLDSASGASAWNNNQSIALQSTASSPLPYVAESQTRLISGGPTSSSAVSLVQSICRSISAIETQLTEYDQVCGDGDCGLTFQRGCLAILNYLERDDSQTHNDLCSLLDGVANTISRSMGGTSGVLIELFLRSMCATMQRQRDGEVRDRVVSAMKAGLAAIQLYGGATPGMRTMLDALSPGIESLGKGETLSQAAQAALSGAESTKTMEALAGRSNYVNKNQMLGVPDPGAVAVAEVFRVAAEVLRD